MEIAVGDRVTVAGYDCHGTVRYIGPHQGGKKGNRTGVELDQPVGLNDGSVGETTYFKCQPKHGVLCLAQKVEFLMSAADYEFSLMTPKARKESKKEADKAEKAAAKAAKEESKAQAKAEKDFKKSIKKKPSGSGADMAADAAQASSELASPVSPASPTSPTSPASPEPVSAPEAPSVEPPEVADSAPSPAVKTSEEVDSGPKPNPFVTIKHTPTGGPPDDRLDKIQAARVEREARQAQQKKEEEAAKAATEVASKDKASGFANRWQPTDQGPATLSDKEIAERKSQRKGSKFNVGEDLGKAVPADVTATNKAGKLDASLVAYVDGTTGLQTIQRNVGRGKKMVHQLYEENREAQAEQDDRGHLTSGSYVDVITWQFHNEPSCHAFTSLIKEIVQDDRQAEAIFGVYELNGPVVAKQAAAGASFRKFGGQEPSPVSTSPPAAAAPWKQPLFVSVSLGTCQQLIELYQMYDLATAVSADANDERVATATRKSIKSVQGQIFTTVVPDSIGAIADKWNSRRMCNFVTAADPTLAIVGGWKSVAKFCSTGGPELIIVNAQLSFVSESAAATYRGKCGQKKTAKEAVRFASMVSPTKVSFFSVTLTTAFAQSGFGASPPPGMTEGQVFLLGAGAKQPAIVQMASEMAFWPGAQIYVADRPLA